MTVVRNGMLISIYPQVLRYSALATGVLYGLYHQATLSAKSKINQVDRDYEHQSSLIQKAKAEYVKKTMPKESRTQGGGGESWCSFLIYAPNLGWAF